MSVILPYQYKSLADKLGAIYAKIRDSVYDESDSTCAYRVAQSTLSEASDPPTYSAGGINAESDYTTWGCTAAGSGESEDPNNDNYSSWISNTTKYTAPPGSIGKDLGDFWFKFVNTTFNDEAAKRLATAQVGDALKKLNSHVVSRMSQGPGESTISNIGQYYSQYAFVSDATATGLGMSASQLSLFDLGDEAGLDASPTYFSQDFAELSARIGVTINSQYVQ